MPTLSSVLNFSVGNFTISAILLAALTFLVCLLVIRLLNKLFFRLLGRTSLEPRLQKFLLSGIRLLLYAITGILVAERLEINTTSLVALLSVCSLGITLAAEDILGNVAGGLVILSSHPFSIGDLIESDGICGTVEEISLNHTKLITPDGLLVMMPNKTLSSAKIINYTTLGRRRVSRTVTASYDAPTEAVKAACANALEQTPNVLSDPAPVVYLSNYQDSAIEYAIYCWATPENYWGVYFALEENLRAAFLKAGVEMTYDHLNVHIVEPKR